MQKRDSRDRDRVLASPSEIIRKILLLSGVWVILIGFGVSSPAFSAQVQAVVDRSSIAAGESIELSVTIEDGDGEVDTSPIKAFKVISQGSSSNFEWINGRSSRKIIYSYLLMPLNEGSLTIPALPVTIDGRVQKTAPITIAVQKTAPGDQDARDVFLKAEVSNSNPYVGEQIQCVFTLYNAIQITAAQFLKPAFEGFSAKEIENQNTQRVVVNGREYISRKLIYVLIPRNSGALTIEPAEIQLNVVKRDSRRGMRSPFDDFFGRTQVEPRFLKSEPVTVSVKPLPPLPPNQAFSGLVGQFELSGTIERTQLTVGDSVTYALTLSGTGNIAEAPEVRPSAPEAFKHYNDSPQEEIQLSAEGYTGKKIFRTALVPVKPGEFVLPEVMLTYFDINDKHYKSLKTEPITLEVKASAAPGSQTPQVAPGPSSSAKHEVTFTGRDILPLNEDLDALENQSALSLHWFLFWIFLPAAGFGLAKLTADILRKEDGRRKRMARQTRKILQDAAKIDPREKEYLSLLYRALVTAIRAGSDTSGESLTWAEAETLLRQSGYDEQTAMAAASLLENIESANYSGGRANGGDRRELLERTRSMAGKLSR